MFEFMFDMLPFDILMFEFEAMVLVVVEVLVAPVAALT